MTNPNPTPFEICDRYASIALQITLGRRGPEDNIVRRILERGHQIGRWETVEVPQDRLEQAIAKTLSYKGLGYLKTEAGITTFTPTGLIAVLYNHQKENQCPCLRKDFTKY